MFYIKPKLSAIKFELHHGENFHFYIEQFILLQKNSCVSLQHKPGHTKGDKFSQYYEAKWEVLLMIFLMILQNSCTTQSIQQIIIDYITHLEWKSIKNLVLSTP